MEAIERIAGKVGAFKVADVPVGQAALLLTGLGLSEGLLPLLTPMLKQPVLSGAALAVIARLPIVKRILGTTISDVLMATAMAVGLDQQINIRGRMQGYVASLVGRITPTAGISAKTAGTGGAGKASPILGENNERMLTEQERRMLSALRVT